MCRQGDFVTMLSYINHEFQDRDCASCCRIAIYINIIVFVSIGWITSIPLCAVFVIPKSLGGFFALFFGLMIFEALVCVWCGRKLYNEPGKLGQCLLSALLCSVIAWLLGLLAR